MKPKGELSIKKEKPLEGLNVLDFSWVVVGPLLTRHLADYGATVVRVESNKHPDTLRTTAPYKDNQPGIDRSGYVSNYAAGKYSITLDLNHPKGIAIAGKLVKWADIVIDSFATGVIDRLGLGYDELRRIKPDIIMVSTSQLRQSGPYPPFRGYGMHGAALAGFYSITGWPGREPIGPYGAYTDGIAFETLLVAVLSAIDYHHRTGEGQRIEQSQVESGIHVLAPAVLDYGVNGRMAGPAGNSHPYAAPHNVYRCRGEDRWCVIAVFTDAEWRCFCDVMGNPPWTRDAKFSSQAQRKKNESELDRLVEERTITRSAEEVMLSLQEKGVSAGVVQTGEDLHRDPQLKHRSHYQVLEHKVIGPHSYDTSSFRLSKTPGKPEWAAPLIGEHSEYVCRNILGMTDDEIAELVVEGVFD
ncbi:CaiB/BaiF CoA transferase family protein [Chloroflexota bacterium]